MTEEIRVNMPSYEDRWARHLIEQFGDEVLAAEDLETFVAEKLAPLDPSNENVKNIAQCLRHEQRTQSPPADDIRDTTKPRWLA